MHKSSGKTISFCENFKRTRGDSSPLMTECHRDVGNRPWEKYAMSSFPPQPQLVRLTLC
ncbi:6073_t:CDS:2 [Acaulospora morrowiae]|uniref:6073_t:CDS:1 n=1 Tax=Acaulospora morrowiae TaxID=94023 RepID=A0A9N9HM97_9GLOM|nr:6073_t:CDS:2 [Acaulospora morrowiae]